MHRHGRILPRLPASGRASRPLFGFVERHATASKPRKAVRIESGWLHAPRRSRISRREVGPGQPGETSMPVTIALSDPAPRCHGHLFYTKLVAHSRGHVQQFGTGDALQLSGAC